MTGTDPFHLGGRTALVTGARRAIGRAAAVGPTRAGAAVILHLSSSAPDYVAGHVLVADGGWLAR